MDGLKRQHSVWSFHDGLKFKGNRYADILPYDRNRVKLITKDGYHNYINASHVHLPFQSSLETPLKQFIVSQGPTEKTTPQFWRMCHDECKSDRIVIVMLTPLKENEKEKCFPYWMKDASYSSKRFQGTLSLKKGKSFAYGESIVVTELALGDKMVYHVHFTDWKDYDRPYSFNRILSLSRLVHELVGLDGLLVVHCSAGVGRSGTFLVAYYILNYCRHLLADYGNGGVQDPFKTPDGAPKPDLIYDLVLQLRAQRMMMVQSRSQYFFLYMILRWWLLNRRALHGQM